MTKRVVGFVAFFGAGCALISLLLLTASGCAVMEQKMVNPSTGRSVVCSHFGFGIIGTPAAVAMQENCKVRARSQGYTVEAP